ncbi:hypothetical protein [Streptomyces sp. NPDC058664]|uniref:hypothetical protein n=1 Tax=unclassified Streptomyces TaxID=2593676 RepID=UPI003667A101
MSDSTQQPAEQPVQPPAPEPPVQQSAPEPAVTFLRRHGAVITLALLFLGYVLHDRPALRKTIGALATAAAPGTALMALTLVRPPVTRSTGPQPGRTAARTGSRAVSKPAPRPACSPPREGCIHGCLHRCLHGRTRRCTGGTAAGVNPLFVIMGVPAGHLPLGSARRTRATAWTRSSRTTT